MQLAPIGGRLIIALDGVWDTMSSRRAAMCCRGVQQPEIAARHVVKVSAYKLIEILLKLIDGQE